MENQAPCDEIVNLVGELKLRFLGQSLKSDLDEMSESEKQTILKYLPKWAQHEKAERRSRLIASRIQSALCHLHRKCGRWENSSRKSPTTRQKTA